MTDLHAALTSQYRASLAMLRQCVERCPEDLWTEAPWPRTYWRIVYHAAFYADFYMQPAHDQMSYWDHHDPEVTKLWDDAPETARRTEPYTSVQMLDYLDQIDKGLEATVGALDLDSRDSGFPWYPIPKIDHQLVNLRHIQGHVGQLSELLMARGIDLNWIGTHASRRHPGS